jgi:tetratricopeptide (TPR) repeat protein
MNLKRITEFSLILLFVTILTTSNISSASTTPSTSSALTIPSNLSANSFSELLDKSKRAEKAGHMEEAIKLLKEANKLKPEDIVVIWNIAKLYYANKNNQKCIEWCNKGLQIDERSTSLLVGRGIAQKEEGNLDKAEADLKKAINIDPKWDVPYIVLGEVYEKYPNKEFDDEGLLKLAITNYEKGLILAKTNNNQEFEKYVKSKLIIALINAFPDDNSKALKYRKRAVELGPNLWITNYKLAEQYNRDGKLKEASKWAQKAMGIKGIPDREKTKCESIIYEAYVSSLKSGKRKVQSIKDAVAK